MTWSVVLRNRPRGRDRASKCVGETAGIGEGHRRIPPADPDSLESDVSIPRTVCDALHIQVDLTGGPWSTTPSSAPIAHGTPPTDVTSESHASHRAPEATNGHGPAHGPAQPAVGSPCILGGSSSRMCRAQVKGEERHTDGRDETRRTPRRAGARAGPSPLTWSHSCDGPSLSAEGASSPMPSIKRSRSSRFVNSSVIRPFRLPTSMRTGVSKRFDSRLVRSTTWGS